MVLGRELSPNGKVVHILFGAETPGEIIVYFYQYQSHLIFPFINMFKPFPEVHCNRKYIYGNIPINTHSEVILEGAFIRTGAFEGEGHL